MIYYWMFRFRMTTGYKTRLENIGKVNNKGVEFNIATNQKMGDFNWSVYFNISKNINEVKGTRTW